jgi:NAD-dependent histone deacetylase SIR2
MHALNLPIDVHLLLLQNDDTRPTFCKFIAEMATTAAMAKPTRFHELLATLNSRQRLLRVYTQNIDGLELKSGLSTFPGYGMYNERAICIPLHGNLNQMRCQSCGSTVSLDPHLRTLMAGQLPTCVICEASRTARAELHLRDRKTITSLRPDIILYGEDHPLADEIAEIVKVDARAVGCLLVVGTSMKVDGIQHIIRTFTQALDRKHGKKKAPLFSSIYLNTEMSGQKKWSEVFDFWVKGNCELFATMIQEELDRRGMKTRETQIQIQMVPTEVSGEGEEESSASNLKQRMALTDRRLDLRPLWRYY